MCRFEELIKEIELEQLHRNRFTTKFKTVRGFDDGGSMWVRFIYSDSKNKVEQMSTTLYEFQEYDAKQTYKIMVHQWEKHNSPKRLDFFQAEWERVNA